MSNQLLPSTRKLLSTGWSNNTAKARIGLGEGFADKGTRQRPLGENRVGEDTSPGAFCRGISAKSSPRQNRRYPAKKGQSPSSNVRYASGVCQTFAEYGCQGSRRSRNAETAPRVRQTGAGETLRRDCLRRVPSFAVRRFRRVASSPSASS